MRLSGRLRHFERLAHHAVRGRGWRRALPPAGCGGAQPDRRVARRVEGALAPSISHRCNNTNTVNITLPRRLAAALKTSPSHSSPPTQDVARHIIVSPSPDSTARTLLPPAEKRWLPLHGFSSHLLPFHAPFPGRGPPHHSLPLARRHCADSFAARREALAAAARLRLLTPLTLHNLPRM